MSQRPGMLERNNVSRRQAGAMVLALLLTVIAAILQATSLTVATFIVSAVALAVLATLVGSGTEQLGARLGPGATGVLQSALGNLPELFIGIFALRASLVSVVQAALIGSILGNSLLVLGLAFALGGLRHGTQRFNPETPRNIATLTLLAVSAIVVPTLATRLNTPAAPHAAQLSVACAIVLLVVFVASIPFSLQGGPTKVEAEAEAKAGPSLWPLALTLAVLLGAGLGAALRLRLVYNCPHARHQGIASLATLYRAGDRRACGKCGRKRSRRAADVAQQA